MSFDAANTTVDGFLGGALQIRQPIDGYRAATDPVFLAASVLAKAGDTVLELGCGAGVASLCLAWRLPQARVTGLELQSDYAELARMNAQNAGILFDVVEGDLSQMPPCVERAEF
jgi:tRNA1(Val) A37 N6-methylase TrmN6